MNKHPNTQQSIQVDDLTDNPGYEILYRMVDKYGNLHGIPFSKVDVALSRGIHFKGEDEIKLYKQDLEAAGGHNPSAILTPSQSDAPPDEEPEDWRTRKESPLSAERKAIDLRYLKKTLEDEQRLRDAIAKEHGWSKHPNDLELEPEQMKIVLEAWEQKKPPPDFL